MCGCDRKSASRDLRQNEKEDIRRLTWLHGVCCSQIISPHANWPVRWLTQGVTEETIQSGRKWQLSVSGASRRPMWSGWTRQVKSQPSTCEQTTLTWSWECWCPISLIRGIYTAATFLVQAVFPRYHGDASLTSAALDNRYFMNMLTASLIQPLNTKLAVNSEQFQSDGVVHIGDSGKLTSPSHFQTWVVNI